jgi:hypothetical protein
VTLRGPPPLDRPLRLDRLDDRASLFDGCTLIAEARRAELRIDVREPISFEEAVRASAGYKGFERHAFPTCFVCGPKREPGDGLRIFAAAVEGHVLGAAPWNRSAFVGAAPDCPGAFAVGSPTAARCCSGG